MKPLKQLAEKKPMDYIDKHVPLPPAPNDRHKTFRLGHDSAVRISGVVSKVARAFLGDGYEWYEDGGTYRIRQLRKAKPVDLRFTQW